MRRSLAAGLALAALGAVAYRRRGGRLPSVELYYEDGSSASYPAGSPEAARLLPLAEALLEAAR
jgi:hypothetical protein